MDYIILLKKNKTEEWPRPTQMPSLYRACQQMVDGRKDGFAAVLISIASSFKTGARLDRSFACNENEPSKENRVAKWSMA